MSIWHAAAASTATGRQAVVGLKETGMDVETLGRERIKYFEGELARLEREAEG